MEREGKKLAVFMAASSVAILVLVLLVSAIMVAVAAKGADLPVPAKQTSPGEMPIRSAGRPRTKVFRASELCADGQSLRYSASIVDGAIEQEQAWCSEGGDD